MNMIVTLERTPVREGRPARDRGPLAVFSRLAASAGAEQYLVLEMGAGAHGEAAILTANWIYDAVREVGRKALAELAAGPLATAPGTAPRMFTAGDAAARGLLDLDAALALEDHGHFELCCVALLAGRLRAALLLSAARPGAITPAGLARVQIQACYALSAMPGRAERCAPPHCLSERERECLRWVADGKTTDEIALILEVSPNTVNSYVTLAIQKLSASNRAMAIATAIRSGII